MTRTASSRLQVLPQRHGPKGWQLCPDHQAQAWAVIDTLRGKTLTRWQHKARAEDYRRSLVAALKPKRRLALGSLCPQRLASSSLIATSSNHKPERY